MIVRRTPSKVFEHATWEPESNTLDLTFHNGTRLVYNSVPQSICWEMMYGPSAGRTFATKIRGVYPTAPSKDTEIKELLASVESQLGIASSALQKVKQLING